jgi:hypothetical protein
MALMSIEHYSEFPDQAVQEALDLCVTFEVLMPDGQNVKYDTPMMVEQNWKEIHNLPCDYVYNGQFIGSAKQFSHIISHIGKLREHVSKVENFYLTTESLVELSNRSLGSDITNEDQAAMKEGKLNLNILDTRKGNYVATMKIDVPAAAIIARELGSLNPYETLRFSRPTSTTPLSNKPPKLVEYLSDITPFRDTTVGLGYRNIEIIVSTLQNPQQVFMGVTPVMHISKSGNETVENLLRKIPNTEVEEFFRNNLLKNKAKPYIQVGNRIIEMNRNFPQKTEGIFTFVYPKQRGQRSDFRHEQPRTQEFFSTSYYFDTLEAAQNFDKAVKQTMRKLDSYGQKDFKNLLAKGERGQIFGFIQSKISFY